MGLLAELYDAIRSYACLPLPIFETYLQDRTCSCSPLNRYTRGVMQVRTVVEFDGHCHCPVSVRQSCGHICKVLDARSYLIPLEFLLSSQFTLIDSRRSELFRQLQVALLVEIEWS